MAKYAYSLYDTAVFGTSLGGEQALFQVAQGADATHTKAFTNMRGAGSLPPNESFEIRNIMCFLDEPITVAADAQNVWQDSYIEVRVNDESLLFLPLRVTAGFNGFGGHFTQASAANAAPIGLIGNGYDIDPTILIPGGTAFRVNVNQGTVLSAASQNLRVLLNGILDRK